MGWLDLAGTVYVSLVLGVSAIAKLDNRMAFRATLGKHGIWPQAAIPFVVTLLPGGQLLLASLLIFGVQRTYVAATCGALFAVFLLVEVVLIRLRRATDCGCYGVAFRLKVDGSSVAASAIQVAIAVGLVFGSGVLTELPQFATPLFSALTAITLAALGLLSLQRKWNAVRHGPLVRLSV